VTEVCPRGSLRLILDIGELPQLLLVRNRLEEIQRTQNDPNPRVIRFQAAKRLRQVRSQRTLNERPKRRTPVVGVVTINALPDPRPGELRNDGRGTRTDQSQTRLSVVKDLLLRRPGIR